MSVLDGCGCSEQPVLRDPRWRSFLLHGRRVLRHVDQRVPAARVEHADLPNSAARRRPWRRCRTSTSSGISAPDLRPMFDAHGLMRHIVPRRRADAPPNSRTSRPNWSSSSTSRTASGAAAAWPVLSLTVATVPGVRADAARRARTATTRTAGTGASTPAEGAGHRQAPRRADVLRGLPQGRRPGRAIRADEAPAGLRLPQAHKQPCPSKVVPKLTEIKPRADAPEAPAATI